MKIKIKGSGSSWGFVETYDFSNSGESRTVRFIAGFNVDSMSLVHPSTFFGMEFQKIKLEDVEKYCGSKKPFHSQLAGKTVPISVRVSLRNGVVTVKAQPFMGSITVPETTVLLGNPSEKIRDAIQEQLSTFIRAGRLSRKSYYKERVAWAQTSKN